MLFPSSCPGCGAAGPAPCAPCRSQLVAVGSIDPPPGLDSCAALLSYQGSGAALVTALKYRNARGLVPWLGRSLAALVPDDATVVTWAATTATRRRRRGFDQAQLLARGTARRARLPLRRLLVRADRNTQTGAGRAARLHGPRYRSKPVRGARVVVVDDVITTGATLTAAASALRVAGAAAVHAVAVGSTPDPSRQGPVDPGREQNARFH